MLLTLGYIYDWPPGDVHHTECHNRCTCSNCFSPSYHLCVSPKHGYIWLFFFFFAVIRDVLSLRGQHVQQISQVEAEALGFIADFEQFVLST